jgi:hypothetical protein
MREGKEPKQKSHGGRGKVRWKCFKGKSEVEMLQGEK